MAQPRVNQWSHELLGCFDDFGLCIMSYFCPCLQFGQNAEATGKGCFIYGAAFMIPILNLLCAVRVRGDLRQIRAIEGTTANDFLVWCCCPLCALVQESQEIKNISRDVRDGPPLPSITDSPRQIRANLPLESMGLGGQSAHGGQRRRAISNTSNVTL